MHAVLLRARSKRECTVLGLKVAKEHLGHF
jgi:hypothetical protein